MPQAIGLAILSTLGATAVSATTATLVGSVVIAGALTGAQLLLAPKPDIPKPQDGKIMLKQAVPPAIYAYGRCRISGAYLAYELKGSTSYDVIALHQGEIDGFERFYLNDDLVVFSTTTIEGPGDGSVDGPVRMPGPFTGRYMGNSIFEKRVSIYWRKGATPSPHYQRLAEALPEVWTDDHRADGIATLLLICQMDDAKTFPRRYPFGLPKPSVVARWRCCWDPRDPMQDHDDPSSWKFSDNPIVCLLDFYCHHEAGYLRPVQEVYLKRAAWWIAAMNLCDDLRPKADGTSVKNYTCGGQFTSETPRKSVVEALLRSCDGWVSEYGDGSIIVYAGGYFPPSITIEDRHIYDLKISRGRLPDERVTKLNLKVVSPDHDYNEVSTDPWVSRLASDAGATPIVRDAKAEWVQEWTQARVLGKIEFEKLRCDIRGTLIGRPFCENLRGRRYFMLNSVEQNSTRMVPCEVVDFHDSSFENGSYEIEFQSVNPNRRYRWEPERDEGRRPAIPDKAEGDELPVPPTPTLAVVRQSTGGGDKIALISATAPPVEGWPELGLAGRYRKAETSAWLPMFGDSGELQCFSGSVGDGLHEVQTWYVGGGDGKSDPSPVGTIEVDVDDVAPPPAVSLFATAVDDNIAVTFTVDENADNVRKARVYRATSSSSSFSDAVDVSGKISATAGQTKTWVDMSTAPATTYRYWVVLLNKSGVASAPQGPAEVTTDD
ncbi:hypothetical protein [Methylopila sp. M107]|uniref:hypothetical protein n=1 Tax=Methylopila sp. M107 TaxID=1101190 RepID=UPI000370E433|nr:hypothetical protein [Methylopila sp. M107]